MTRNVVLICLDSVRKDFFDEHATRLQDLATVSFEQCRAASSWTVPSHASMLTGRLPHQHGVHTHNRDMGTLALTETFLADLPTHRLLGASANVYAGPEFGFADFFDEFSDVSPHRRFSKGMDVERYLQEERGDGRYRRFLTAALRHDHTLLTIGNGLAAKLNHLSRRAPFPKPFDDGASLVSREARELVDASEEPFFLFTNFMDAHAPLQPIWYYDRSLYRVPNRWHSYKINMWDVSDDGRLNNQKSHLQYHRQLYDAAIEYLDRVLSTLIQTVSSWTSLETTFVITADHGENLGFSTDGRRFEHMISDLSEGLLHVPLLLVNPPDGYPARVQQYVSHLSLGDLLVGLASGETPEVTSERIAAERIGLGAVDAPVNGSATRFSDRMVRCVFDGETKVQWDSLGDVSGFELSPERGCWQRRVPGRESVPSWRTDWFDVDIDTYKSLAKTGTTHRDVSEAARRRLSDLGYR